jgi:hypothetical protein
MELEVNTEVNLLGNNLTENNINILKKVAFRYAEDVVIISNGDLSSGDIERIKFIVNNIVNKHVFTPEVSDINVLEDKGYQLRFKAGSALGMINSLVNTAKEEDICNIVKLYSNEGNIFISELKNLVRPVITGLIETFNIDIKIFPSLLYSLTILQISSSFAVLTKELIIPKALPALNLNWYPLSSNTFISLTSGVKTCLFTILLTINFILSISPEDKSPLLIITTSSAYLNATFFNMLILFSVRLLPNRFTSVFTSNSIFLSLN